MFGENLMDLLKLCFLFLQCSNVEHTTCAIKLNIYLGVKFSFNLLVSLFSHLSDQHECLFNGSISTVLQLDNSGLVTRYTCLRRKL